MKRVITLFVFAIILSRPALAHPITLGDSASKDSSSFNYFHLDAKASFFQWQEKPLDFEFKLMDKWGNVLAQSCNPDFVIDEALTVAKDRFRENELYTFEVVIKDTAGCKRKFTGQVYCLGYYTSG